MEELWEEITDAQHMLRPAVDQIRRREHGEWTPWEFVVVRMTVETAIAGFLSHSFEFRKPKPQPDKLPEPQPQPQDDWEFISDPNHKLRVGIDQKRWRMRSSETGIWTKWTAWESAHSVIRVGDLPKDDTEWQCRKPKQQPEAEQAATVDRGERYQRRIHQSIDGPGKGESIVVDLADVFNAFGVPYMLGQAVKKAVIPGDRGAKDRLKDLREAVWSIQRQIQIEEAKGNGPF